MIGGGGVLSVRDCGISHVFFFLGGGGDPLVIRGGGGCYLLGIGGYPQVFFGGISPGDWGGGGVIC